METSIGQYAPVFLPGEPPLPDREAWQAKVYREAKSQTQPKRPCLHRWKTFLPAAALPQWELSVKVDSCLACRDPGGAKYAGTWTASSTGVMALSGSFFEPLIAGNQKASGHSFSIALPVQALRGFPYLGTFSVVWQVRNIEGPPAWGPSL